MTFLSAARARLLAVGVGVMFVFLYVCRSCASKRYEAVVCVCVSYCTHCLTCVTVSEKFLKLSLQKYLCIACKIKKTLIRSENNCSLLGDKTRAWHYMTFQCRQTHVYVGLWHVIMLVSTLLLDCVGLVTTLQ